MMGVAIVLQADPILRLEHLLKLVRELLMLLVVTLLQVASNQIPLEELKAAIIIIWLCPAT